MAFDPVSAVADLGKTLLDKFVVDKNKKMEIQQRIDELKQQGDMKSIEYEVQLMLAQIKVNEAEASSGNFFIAGWRPAAGWVASISLAMIYIPKITLLTVLWMYQCYVVIASGVDVTVVNAFPEFPELGVTDLIGLLMSLLGVGIMRTFEKRNGIDTKRITK